MKGVILAAAVMAVFVITACSTSNADLEVSLSYTPKNPVAGDLVTFTVDVYPRPFAQVGSKAILKVGDEVYQSDFVPFTKELRLPEGTLNVSAEYVYGDGVRSSASLSIEVGKLSEKYNVFLDVPDRATSGEMVPLRAGVIPEPDFNEWRIQIRLDGEVVCDITSDSTGCDLKPPVGYHEISSELISSYGRLQGPIKVIEVLDSTPPEIEDLGVLPATPVEGEPAYVYVRFSDLESDQVTVDVYLDGTLKGQTSALGNVAFLPLGSVESGSHQIMVVARNSSGYASYESTDLVIFRRDVFPPQVTVDSEKYIFSSSEPVNFSFTVEDDGGIAEYRIFLDGNLVEEDELNGLTSYSGTIELGTIGSGLHVLTVEAKDEFGRLGFSRVEFFVSENTVGVVLAIEPSELTSGDYSRFLISPEVSFDEIENLKLLLDGRVLYEYTKGGTESLAPFIEWIAEPGKHRATVILKTSDGRYGLDTITFKVRDINPPVVESIYVNGTKLSTDTYSPAIVSVGVHRVAVHVVDDGGLKKDDILTVEVYDINGEEKFLQTVVLQQSEISRDEREATYTTTLNFPIGKYKLLPVNVSDADGNVLEKGNAFYMRVVF